MTSGFCTPVGDGGCGLVDPTQTEGNSCFNAAGCGCPQICFGPDGGATCAYPCTTTADCQEPTEICVGGGCVFDACGPGAAPDGGDLGSVNGPCNASGTGDGTCFAQVFNTPFGTVEAYSCYAAGTSTTSCDPGATRGQPASLCKQGYGCFAGVDAGSCVPLCNSTALDAGLGCGVGLGCYEYASITVMDSAPGECLAPGDGGCFELPPANTELDACNTNADCACPQSCSNDPTFGKICETPCQATTDCPNAVTSCQSSLCQLNYCAATPAGKAAPGQYDGACNAAGTNDGTCLPTEVQTSSTTSTPYGLCSQGGSAAAGAGCTEARGAALCTVGGICLEDPSGNSVCSTVCNPAGDAGVCGGGGNACLIFDPNNSAAGYCGPCIADGGMCSGNGDCCSNDCDTANTGTCF